MQLDPRWPRWHTAALFLVQAILIFALVGINSALRRSDEYTEGLYNPAQAALVLNYALPGVELVALLVQTTCFCMRRLRPILLFSGHGCLTLVWLAQFAIIFVNQGIYQFRKHEDQENDCRWNCLSSDDIPLGIIHITSAFVILCLLASVYVTVFSFFVWRRNRHSSDIHPESAETRASELPKQIYTEKDAGKPKPSAANAEEELQYPFTPQELPNPDPLPTQSSYNSTNPSPSPFPLPVQAGYNSPQAAGSVVINGVTYLPVSNAQSYMGANLPELPSPIPHRKPVGLTSGYNG